MKNKKIIAILCLVFLLSGCWDRREPELRALALAGGIDIDDNGMYVVTVQFANPQAIGDEDTGGHQGKSFSVYSARGYTPFEATRNLSMGITRELIWSHSRLFIISEKLARQGISTILDLLERDPQTRLLGHPLVLEGDMAKLLKIDFPLEITGARAIERQIKTATLARSMFPLIVSLRELLIILSRPGEELVVGKIAIPPDPKEKAEDDPSVQIGGGAAFRKDKMVGWLNEQHMRGYNFIKGQAGNGVLVIDCPVDKKEKLTFEFFGFKRKIKPLLEGDEIRYQLNLIIEGSILEITGSGGELTHESDYTRSLKKRISQVIRNDIEASLARAQELKSDYLGLGNILYRNRPELWDKVKESWYDIFPELVMDIDVEVIIRRTGLITSPL